MRLDVKDLNFSYDGKEKVLKDVSFALDGAEIISVLGKNGAGKTTLLKCLTGFNKVKDGEILYDGKSISEYKNTLWRKVSYVPQAHSFSYPYTCLELVTMGRNPHKGAFSLPDGEDEKRAAASLESLGLLDIKDKPCTKISGGQLQLVMIARALVNEPELLILDEPENSLDLKNQIRLLDLLKKICKNKGEGIILNTHFAAHAKLISDKLLLLKADGSTVFKRKEEVNEKLLSEIYEVSEGDYLKYGS